MFSRAVERSRCALLSPKRRHRVGGVSARWTNRTRISLAYRLRSKANLPGSTAAGSNLNRLHRLRKIADDVVGVFEPHGKAYEVLANA